LDGRSAYRKSLPTQDKTSKKRGHISISQLGFITMSLVFEWSKRIDILDCVCKSLFFLYTGCPRRRLIFWEVIVSVILSKKVYMYMRPIPIGFRNGAILLYSSKTADKEILRVVSETSIYCSSDKVGTVYLVNINALCSSCEDMACCSPVQCTVYCTVK
jgi:hypothetical protein